MKIALILADNQAIGESVKALLPEDTLPLLEPSVACALRRLINAQPDYIVIDDAPKLGERAIAELKNSVPQTPIIALASRKDGEYQAAFILAGAKTCVTKPFTCEELLSAIRDTQQPHPRVPSPGAPRTWRTDEKRSITECRRALRWLAHGSLHSDSSGEIAQNLAHAVADIFGAVRTAVLLESEHRFRVRGAVGLAENITANIRLQSHTGLMRWFEEHPCIFHPAAMEAPPQDAVKEMAILGAQAAAPLLCGGRPFGAVVIGERASGVPLEVEDCELLTTVAQAASQAFERARQHRNLTRQQKRLDAVLSHIQAGVVTVKSDKTISMINNSAEGILHVRAAEVLGKSVQKLGSGFADVALKTMRDGRPHLRVVINDPAVHAELGLSATPLGAQGVVVIFSVLPKEEVPTEEITHSPFWEHLASRVAQEIKNPMVAINTFAQLLPSKYDSEDFRTEFSAVVQREIQRINGVVETLFRFAEHPRLSLQEIHLRDTVGSVLTTFDEELRTRSINVQTAWATDEPTVALDNLYFSQAIHNVIQNSIEAMPSGGTLKVGTKRNNGNCELTIADDGPGINESDAAQIFLPFFSTKETGMGLGLTVATRIARQHEGDLRLVERPEGGTTFEFSLPSAEDRNADRSSH